MLGRHTQFSVVFYVPRYQDHLSPRPLTQMLIGRCCTLRAHEIKNETPEDKTDPAAPYPGHATSYHYYQIGVVTVIERG